MTSETKTQHSMTLRLDGWPIFPLAFESDGSVRNPDGKPVGAWWMARGAVDAAETDERRRPAQLNEIANIVAIELVRVWPDAYPVLDLRYGIADAVWAAGYRLTEGVPNDK